MSGAGKNAGTPYVNRLEPLLTQERAKTAKLTKQINVLREIITEIIDSVESEIGDIYDFFNEELKQQLEEEELITPQSDEESEEED
jgi:hypothetical protein